MRILIDESLPRALKRALVQQEAFTVQELGWTGTKNGALLAKAAPFFDVFLTGDKNLRYQQNLAQLELSIVVFPSNRLRIVQSLVSELATRLESIQPGQLVELDMPDLPV